jgi:outer membrane biosynthesis protein TonB
MTSSIEYLLQPEVEIANKKKSATLTAIIIIVFLLLAFLVRMLNPEPDFPEEGILIAFGNTETGQGYEPPSQQSVPAANSAQETVEEVQEELQPTDDVNASEVNVTEEKEIVKNETPVKDPVEDPSTSEQNNPDPEPEKTKYTYSSSENNQQTQSSSQGNNMNNGDMGDPRGSEHSNNMGTDPGLGKAGVSGYLSGRGVANQPSVKKKVRNEQGVIKLEIFVNPNGRVVRTGNIIRGTEVTDPAMLKEAREIAMKFSFEAKADAPALQKGTVTIVFKY